MRVWRYQFRILTGFLFVVPVQVGSPYNLPNPAVIIRSAEINDMICVSEVSDFIWEQEAKQLQA
jgi:hypothetical protein